MNWLCCDEGEELARLEAGTECQVWIGTSVGDIYRPFFGLLKSVSSISSPLSHTAHPCPWWLLSKYDFRSGGPDCFSVRNRSAH